MIWKLFFVFFAISLTVPFVGKLRNYMILQDRCITVPAKTLPRVAKNVSGPKPSAGLIYSFEFEGKRFEGTVDGFNLFSQPLFTTTMIETGLVKPEEQLTACIDPETFVHLPYKPSSGHYVLLILNYLLWMLIVFAFYFLILQLRNVRRDSSESLQ